ncbi:proteasome subunit alpha [Ruania zhangjianzhongii]|uniref:proteasome subunit alpha n=1 Tax=Ruania zhangjianzhongii TaxID=2603206 RepID=UPI0011CC7F2E|nr:proteasome subunit alpha [Ruania zhangjianzhongii]
MTQPFYVSPEQLMKDRADFARKGIARGRSVVVLGYDDGIAFVTENPSGALHKISEIYDRIGFAAVGKYNEFENLRVAGVRYADLRGYSYDRDDVNARGLANAYAQTLGAVFTTEAKPLEVELAVAEVGADQSADQLYRLSYDGSVADEPGFVVMGGAAEQLSDRVRAEWQPGLSLPQVLALAVRVLAGSGENARTIRTNNLEAAVLDRTRPRRTFRRLTAQRLTQLLAEAPAPVDTEAAPAADESADPPAADAASPAASRADEPSPDAPSPDAPSPQDPPPSPDQQ